MTAAGVLAAGGSTPTPHNVTTPTPVPTPVPTPAPRTVFSDPRWDTDHVSIMVTNTGAPISVEAYIDTPSNKNIVPVDTGVSKRVSTLSITPENGRIVNYGFKAYENGTLIQSFENSLVISASPTPPPETATISGTVVDSATNLPINGAEVILTSETYDKQYPSAFTDTSGTFVTVGKIYPDSYMVTIKASGYQTLTGMRIPNVVSGAQKITNPIKLDPITVATPTSAPTAAPSSTPGSPMDAWLNLLYSPQACCGTLAVGLGAIVSVTAIYEWTMRQRERRKKEAAEGKKESKDPKEPK
ncbi:MAG TPA: carboxypeptidase regulatory-like domain-containing protein [Methanocella sp.]|nr:carboxypeptidase regulatory-like domain-containing protein [Methanocella sp.]